MADAKIVGRERLFARFSAIPEAIRAEAEGPLQAGVEDMRDALKRAAPVEAAAQYEKHPGELRDSIEAYRNPDRPLSWRIIAGARDEAGRLWARFLEFGHGSAAPSPFWFPTYRARRKAMRSKMVAAAKRGIRKLFPEG